MMDVYALGSCRLRAPLLHLHRDGVIRLTNAASSWYAHNSAECLQRIAMTDGDMPLPEGLRPLILNDDSCPGSWADGVAPILPRSIGLFEVSTRMMRRLDPYVLHSTCVTKQEFAEAESRVMTWEDLAADVARLAARFDYVILVGNVALCADLIRPDPGRAALNSALQDLAAGASGLSYASPNPYISRTRPQDDLVDCNHFKPGFERRMADVYRDALHQVDIAQAKVPPDRPPVATAILG
jgi:hypothetical protein